MNRKVDSLIISGGLAIEREFALSSLNNYLHEIELINSGVPFSELGIKERKAAQMPQYLTMEGELLETSEENPRPEKRGIRRLYLTGVMRSQDGLSTQGISTLVRDVEEAANDPEIKGIILEVNTGGGEVTAAQMLKSSIQNAVAKKPVMVFAHFMASGGILGTLPASEIIASDHFAEFGSIGVLISLDKEIIEWYKQWVDDIYSRKSPDKNSEWREYLKGNKAPLEDEVTQLDEMFMADVRKYRPLKGNVAETLAGGMFLAKDAKTRGLIDGIGGVDYVIQRMKSHLKTRNKK